ncbi:MAG TPA: RiPP maturation radical SAM C-methyltransferase [Bryobacteraceae bacterium]|nr:RiPP maturation radical SAM protein 1 [Bryobacterales bacterium]HRJ18618.1 RiPP maturation radical SAM C-methyltransferase [Bryobacteraceae bacterium]
MKILLLSLPFGALGRQALGLSLLKPLLRAHGHQCDVRYLTFPFAELAGHDHYRWLHDEAPYTAFAGDWAFTEALYGPRPAEDARYFDEVLTRTWRLNEASLQRVRTVRAAAGPFLQWCLEAIDFSRYDAIGFTSTFEQNIASLALAKLLKRRHPHLAILFGGANWEGEMGLELHRQFDFVDFVCGGEAERSLPALLDRLAARRPVHDVPGLVFRHQGESWWTGNPDRLEQLDDLPLPDYSDYFRDLNDSTLAAEVTPALLFETSRGCWWGAKSHCTFCGLNGAGMAFRSKSAPRALDELLTLSTHWNTSMVAAVDNILDMSYFRDFLPTLAARQPGLEIFYEVKANLSRRQLRLLREAGVNRIQPGIESMSDHVLQLMRKGTTGLQNIQLLKWCRDYGIHADWNLLHGFPGETPEDYRKLLPVLRAIRHLAPPVACGPLRLDRFSPYHSNPSQYGLRNIRPMETYRHLYPFTNDVLLRIAYYFDFDYAPGEDPEPHSREVRDYCAQWKAAPDPGTLTAVRRPDGSLGLLDTRSSRAREGWIFHGLEQQAYEFCDTAHTPAAIARHLRVPEENVLAFLDSATANGLMVTDGTRYLSLAQATRPLRREWEQAAAGHRDPTPFPIHPVSANPVGNAYAHP